ncbi:MAG: protein kinase [Anaerolineales bacterium]|nr:protein kinase [Anaerolineales bacterium]
MQEWTLFDRYSAGAKTQSHDWGILYNGLDTHSQQEVRIVSFEPAAGPTGQVLSSLQDVQEKLKDLASSAFPVWLKTGEADGRAMLVSNSPEGESLASRLQNSGVFSPENVIELGYQLGKFLEQQHTMQLFQGAFSPYDVFLSSPDQDPVQAQVAVPALASILDLAALLTSSPLQERSCWAPELLQGQPPGFLPDLYALGTLLFEALTGHPVPPPGLSPDQTMIVTWLPSRLRRDIPPALDDLVATCLNPDPAKRYPDIQTLLSVVQDQRPDPAPPQLMGMEDSLVGQTLGAYRLMERLGQGGMATVYKAYEPALDRYVAIKVLPQFFASDPNFTARFRREAKAVAQLNHPNIVPIYSFGETNGISYIAMQYVEGGTLKHVRGEQLDCPAALQLLLPIARALGYAHQRGIIHRDVKPSNVLLNSEGWPLLTDFGLAKMTQASHERLTGTGVGMGTPMYMSPEQGQGSRVDHRSDIYSLGIMLYEFVTGDVPFHADTPMAIVIKHMTAPLPMPRSINPAIPETVETLILKATAKDPDDRFQSAAELAAAMETALDTALRTPAPAAKPAVPVAAPTAVPDRAAAAVPAVAEPAARVPAPGSTSPDPESITPGRARKAVKLPRLALGLVGFAAVVLAGLGLSGVFNSAPDEDSDAQIAAAATEDGDAQVAAATADPTSTTSLNPTLVPAAQAALDRIQSEEPLYQTNFSDWEIGTGESNENVGLINGTLIINSPAGNNAYTAGSLYSDQFAVQYDVRIGQEGEGICGFSVDNQLEDEFRKTLGLSLRADGRMVLEHFLYPEQYPIVLEKDASYEPGEVMTVTAIFLPEAVAVFTDGQPLFTADNPNGPVIYSSQTFSAESMLGCEFDNYRFWNLSDVNFTPIQTAFEITRNEAPVYENTFDTWSFGDPVDDARVEDGKLIVSSPVSFVEGTHVSVTLDSFSLGNFAAEFEFTGLNSSESGHCIFYAGNDESDEEYRQIAMGFHNGGEGNLAFSTHQDTQEDLAFSPVDITSTNRITLLVLGDQIFTIKNGQLMYNVLEPRAHTVYTHMSLAASHNIDCEYDNFRVWDLGETDFTAAAGTTAGPIVSFASILSSIADIAPDYEDDFSSPASGWSTDSTPGSEYGYQDGAFLISSGNDCFGPELPGNRSFSDFILEMDVSFLNQGDGSFSLFFRNNPSSHYGANLTPQGEFNFHKNVNNVHSGLAGTPIPELFFQSWDAPKHLTLVTLQNHMAFYVNGELVVALTDPSSDMGGVNFAVCNGENTPLGVTIDNIRIWDIADITP